MSALGNGLFDAKQLEDALSVREAELSLMRRLGDSESNILIVQGNIANTYYMLGRSEKALNMRQDVYSGRLRHNGEEHEATLLAATNYANSLLSLQRYAEAKSLLRRTVPVARRALGENNFLTLKMRWLYANALRDDLREATLDDLGKAVEILESVARLWTRVFGEAHPETPRVQGALATARVALAARAA